MHNGRVEQHTITVIAIGSNSVTIQVASTPFDLIVAVSQAKTIQLNGESVMKVELEAIQNGQASITFRALPQHQSSVQTPAVIESPAQVSSLAVAIIMCTIFAAGVLAVSMRRRILAR